MASQSFTPVIIGVGDVKNRTSECIEPLQLILKALDSCVIDATGNSDSRLLSQVDSIDAVRSWTWPYDNLAVDIAKEIQSTPQHVYTMDRHSGHSPAYLLDGAARRIASGRSKLAVVSGGEALASLSSYVSNNHDVPPHWTKTEKGLESIFANEMAARAETQTGQHGIGAPTQVYPLYENAFRAQRHHSIQDNHIESTALYADFAKTAASNMNSWNYDRPPETQTSIATVTKKNRMISFPYPLLMNAFNTVNLSAAVLLTSTVHAKALGIPPSKWIYSLGGAGTADHGDFLRRPVLSSSPCISHTLTAALSVSELSANDIDAFDFYSCFPIVPKLACAHLGLPLTPPFSKPISLLGGLTSFGGAGNNYSMHAITEMVRYLRRQHADHVASKRQYSGLVLANGGTITYQYAVVLSTAPRSPSSPAYPSANPLPQSLPSLAESDIASQPEGAATVETYTVDFSRDGKPTTGFVVGRLTASGQRFIAVHGDTRTLNEMASWTGEIVGRSGYVKSGQDGDDLNKFVLDEVSRL